MTPYDFKDLTEKCKVIGLNLSEQAARELTVVLFDWVTESAKASQNTADDIIAALLPVIKPKVLEAIDKINGKVG